MWCYMKEIFLCLRDSIFWQNAIRIWFIFPAWSKMSSIMIMQDRQYSKLSDTFLHFKDFLSINYWWNKRSQVRQEGAGRWRQDMRPHDLCIVQNWTWLSRARLSDVNVENVEVGTKWLTNCTAMIETRGRVVQLISPVQVQPGVLCIPPGYWLRQVTGEILVLLNQVLWWSVVWSSP